MFAIRLKFARALPIILAVFGAGACAFIHSTPAAERKDEPDADRAAAEWVIANGGTIRTAAGTFGKGDPLGNGPFKITAISLGSTDKIKDDDLARFKDLTKLNNLSLANTPIGDAGLKHLAGLKSLESFYLPNTKVGDAGLAHLKDMKGLVNLYLDETKVTDAGLECLTGMKGLSVLYLRHTQITDAGLKHIKAMPKLCWVDLWGTKVTDAGVRELQAALPRCTVKNVDPKNDRPPPPKANQPAEAVDASRARVDPEREPKAGEEREFEIANGVKMKFCWIPSGEAQLGSPMAERDAVLKQLIETRMVDNGKEPAWLSEESDGVRVKFKTKGFWFGKYTVTQAEWKAVMGDNPSFFQLRGTGEDSLRKDGIRDTSRFPVEQVSWDDCQKFLEKLNKRTEVEKVFGKAGQFVLPHEDQWEYACRGGKGNKQAFYFGNELNGTQANCNGNEPYGTDKKGEWKQRTTEVGSYAKEWPHPWGLCDMHGNVWQLCNNNYGHSNDRVLRGGSWYYGARDCRSAYRWDEPVRRYYINGFRICLPLDKYQLP